MADDPRRAIEMKAALQQIHNRQKGQGRKAGRWRLDVSLPKLAVQGMLVFLIGVLVGLGLFVFARVVFDL